MEPPPQPERFIQFVEADLRNLPDLGNFDVCCAMTDTLAHILTDSDLAMVFAGVTRSLAPGGVFVFDHISDHGLRKAMATTAVQDEDDRFVSWSMEPRNLASGSTGFEVRINRFIRDAEDRWQRVAHRLVGRRRSKGLWRELLNSAGMECVAVHGLGATGLLEHDDDQADDMLYVARRAKWQPS